MTKKNVELDYVKFRIAEKGASFMHLSKNSVLSHAKRKTDKDIVIGSRRGEYEIVDIDGYTNTGTIES